MLALSHDFHCNKSYTEVERFRVKILQLTSDTFHFRYISYVFRNSPQNLKREVSKKDREKIKHCKYLPPLSSGIKH